MSKIDVLNKRLKDVKEKFEALRKCGIDKELLEAYLQKKTKLSVKNIRKLINATEEFYDKLVVDEFLENL